VAGRLIESEAELGLDVKNLFHELSEGTELLKHNAPADRFDLKTSTFPTVSSLLKKSTDRLDEETRQRFTFLGAFAPKPATFDIDAMQAVWQIDDAIPTARKLSDRGLLEPIIGSRRFQMHAILVMHAQKLLLD
jgi:hypothetical protein